MKDGDDTHFIDKELAFNKKAKHFYYFHHISYISKARVTV